MTAPGEHVAARVSGGIHILDQIDLEPSGAPIIRQALGMSARQRVHRVRAERSPINSHRPSVTILAAAGTFGPSAPGAIAQAADQRKRHLRGRAFEGDGLRVIQ